MKDILSDLSNMLSDLSNNIFYYLAAGSLGFVFIGVIYIVILGLRKRENGSGNKKRPNGIDQETRNRYIDNISNVYKSFNMKTVLSTVTESLYYFIDCTVNVLKKTGIRKEVEVDIYKERDLNLVIGGFADGKSDFASTTIPCQYSIKYVDNVSDKVLYKKKLKKAYFTMSFLRGANANENNEKYCSNCGSPMMINGDFFVCQDCGTSYTVESTNYVITSTYVTKESRLEAPIALISIFSLGISAILAQATMKLPFILIALGIDAIYILGTIGLVLYCRKTIKPHKELEKYDPLYSRNSFTSRVEYLFRMFERGKDFDIHKLKPYVTKEIFDKLKETNQYDDEYILDYDFAQYRPKLVEFELTEDKQIARFEIKVKEVKLTPKRKVKVKKKKIPFEVYRNKNCLTKEVINPEFFECECCGNSVNITLDGKCKSCGNDFDIAAFDWKIYKAE